MHHYKYTNKLWNCYILTGWRAHCRGGFIFGINNPSHQSVAVDHGGSWAEPWRKKVNPKNRMAQTMDSSTQPFAGRSLGLTAALCWSISTRLNSLYWLILHLLHSDQRNLLLGTFLDWDGADNVGILKPLDLWSRNFLLWQWLHVVCEFCPISVMVRG